MKSFLKKHKTEDEHEIAKWLDKADLSSLVGHVHFKKTKFKDLEPTDWDRLYNEYQKSKPISLRLPVWVISQLKRVTIQTGLAYQTLLRLWIVERLKTPRSLRHQKP